MGVIKSANAPPSVSPFSMKDIENQAQAIISRARQQADQLLAAAQVESVKIKAAAKAAGMAEAEKEGRARGIEQGKLLGKQEALAENRAQLQYGASALTSAASELEAARAELEAAALQEVVRLSIAIGGRIAKRHGIIDPAVLQANLTESLKLVADASNIRIAIHPSQRKTLDAALPQINCAFPSMRHVHIVEDDSISPGGCRVFTRNGQIDADLNIQLERIVDDLLPRTEATP